MSKQRSNTQHKKKGGQPPYAPLVNENEQSVKRRIGGQPGNHNALKIVEGSEQKNIKPSSNKKTWRPYW
jgi:hypothetical protein